jgi:uncharacterized coiled-coil DUF342 family protein
MTIKRYEPELKLRESETGVLVQWEDMNTEHQQLKQGLEELTRVLGKEQERGVEVRKERDVLRERVKELERTVLAWRGPEITHLCAERDELRAERDALREVIRNLADMVNATDWEIVRKT